MAKRLEFKRIPLDTIIEAPMCKDKLENQIITKMTQREYLSQMRPAVDLGELREYHRKKRQLEKRYSSSKITYAYAFA